MPAATRRSATLWAAGAGTAIMPSLILCSAATSAKLVEVKHAHAFDRRADALRVDVKRRHDAKALVAETLVAQQCAAQIARADHGHRPVAVGAQDLANGLDQVVAAIADARMAEMAEVGQVFAHLGIAKAQQSAELAGAGALVPVAHQVLQLAQVQAQPADDRLGDGALGGRAAGFGFGGRSCWT